MYKYKMAFKIIFMLLYSPEHIFNKFGKIDMSGRITLYSRHITSSANITNRRFNEQLRYLEECGVISEVQRPKLGVVEFNLEYPKLFERLNRLHMNNTDRLIKIREILDEKV